MTIKYIANRFYPMQSSPYFFSCFLIWAVLVSVQSYAQIDSYANYEWRIKQEYLFDNYIPSNPKEAFLEIETKSPSESLQRFARHPEDSIRGRLQLTLGKWMAKNWQLHEGSRLSYYFSKAGLTHPDDMVEFLILGLHRYLNGSDLNEKELISRLIERRKSRFYESRKNQKREVLSIDTIQGEPPK